MSAALAAKRAAHRAAFRGALGAATRSAEERDTAAGRSPRGRRPTVTSPRGGCASCTELRLALEAADEGSGAAALRAEVESLEHRNRDLERRTAELEAQHQWYEKATAGAAPAPKREWARIADLERQVESSDAKVKFLEKHLSVMDAHVAALAAGEEASERAAFAMESGDVTPRGDFDPGSIFGGAGSPRRREGGALLSSSSVEEELELARAALKGADAASSELQLALEQVDVENAVLKRRLVEAGGGLSSVLLSEETVVVGGGASRSRCLEDLKQAHQRVLDEAEARLLFERARTEGAQDALRAALAAAAAADFLRRTASASTEEDYSKRYVAELATFVEAKGFKAEARQSVSAAEARCAAVEAQCHGLELRLEQAKAAAAEADRVAAQLVGASAKASQATEKLESAERLARRACEGRDAANAAHDTLRALLESERRELAREAEAAVHAARVEAAAMRRRAADFEAAAAKAYAEGVVLTAGREDVAAAELASAAADRAVAVAERERATLRAAAAGATTAAAPLRAVVAAAYDDRLGAVAERAAARDDRRAAGDLLAATATVADGGWRKVRALVVVAWLAAVSERHARRGGLVVALAAWRRATESARWRDEATRARGVAAAASSRRATLGRAARAFRLWSSSSSSSSSSSMTPGARRRLPDDKENAPPRSLRGPSLYDDPVRLSAERAAELAAKATAAARHARTGILSSSSSTPESSAQRGAVLFRESRDAEHGVVGLDGKSLCGAFQTGACDLQSQTGLVVHRTVDGRAVWQWHACVSCARRDGRFASHARFSNDPAVPSCPHAASSTTHHPFDDASYSSSLNDGGSRLPLQPDRSLERRLESVSGQLRFQETCIKAYEKQRNDLMSALGTALTRLHTLGAHYPHWVWEKYEKGRLERYTYFVQNV